MQDPASPLIVQVRGLLAGFCCSTEGSHVANEVIVTVVGNLTADPELRFTPSGAAVANFTIASTPRSFDRETNSWKDGDALFLRCSIWRQAAENVTETLTRGMRVIAQGRLVQRSFETKEGEKRTVVELQVEDIGPSLKMATAKINKATRDKAAKAADKSDAWQAMPESDPWASQKDEPPF